MPNDLKRHLSLLDAVSVVVGIVTGAGIFVTPQELKRSIQEIRSVSSTLRSTVAH
jgi:hypothetical protein